VNETLRQMPLEVWGLIIVVVWIACGAVAVYVLAKLYLAIQTLTGKSPANVQQITPSPLIVSEHEPFATRNELQAVKEDIEALDGDLKKLRTEIVENGERRRLSIEAKVEESRAENHRHTENVRKELSEKIDTMPDRVIATLRNTGAIKPNP